MKRILLLTEDFNEMTFLETLLKKLGFDTIGIQNPASAQEKAMEINPELMVVSDVIKMQSTHSLVKSIADSRTNLKVILIRSDLNAPSEHSLEHIKHSVKSPVDPVNLIQTLCAVADLNKEQLLNKFYKLGLFSGIKSEKAPMITVTGKIKSVSDTQFIKRLQQVPESKEKSKERSKRYSDVVSNLSEPKVQAVEHRVAIKEAQEYRKRSNDSEIKKIDEQRQSFVRALFKKN